MASETKSYFPASQLIDAAIKSCILHEERRIMHLISKNGFHFSIHEVNPMDIALWFMKTQNKPIYIKDGEIQLDFALCLEYAMAHIEYWRLIASEHKVAF